MPFATRSDGTVEIRPTRTPVRTALAMFILLPAVLHFTFLAWISIDGRMWTWPAAQIGIGTLGLALSPQTWVSLLSILVFFLYWDGTYLLYREDRYVVLRRLVWGKRFIPHRTDVERLPAISVSAKRYPRDDSHPDWKTSFRPRVVVKDGNSRVMQLGEGLSLTEGELLAETVASLVGVQPGPVEQAFRPDKTRP